MTPNILIAALILLCATGLAVVLALRGHGSAPAFIIVLSIWAAVGVYKDKSNPLFSFSIQITKNHTASEAEKEAP